MEYQQIELKGYLRIQLNNIQLIRMEPKQLIQLILGTNGSGKSSLLREITPLPSPYTQYEKGGYKHLKLTHKGSYYEVIQQFDGKSGKYRLIKDGVDIFKGSTTTDYRALIKDEFGLTPDIQTLVDGIVKFSEMDVAKRRLWFTLLSHADYTYAFQYYNRLRSRIRDLQGSLTVSQNRYATELSKVLSEEEIQRTRQQLTEYREIIGRLLEAKPRAPMLKSDLEKFLKEKDQILTEATRRLVMVRNRISKVLNENFITEDINLEICQQHLYRLQGSLETHREARQRLTAELEDLLQQSTHESQISNLSLQDLVELSDRDRKVLADCLTHISIQTGQYPRSDFVTAFQAMFNDLADIVDQIPEEGFSSFTRETRDLALERYRQFEEMVGQVQKQIRLDQQQVEDMDHAKKHHERECPKCHHRWYHGYNEARYQQLKETIAANVSREEELLVDLQKANLWVEEVRRVMELKTMFAQMVRSTAVLAPLWELLMTQTHGMKPRAARKILEETQSQIPHLLRAEMAEKELTRLDGLIEQAKRQSEYDHEQQQKLLQDTEHELTVVQDKIRVQESAIDTYRLLIELFTVVNQMAEIAETNLQERGQSVQHLQDTLRVDHINRLIGIFRQEVSALEQTISKIDIQKSLLDSLNKQIEEHQEEIRLLKLAEQAMSPSTGLIAKGLTGFINWFVSRMNQFVKHIWTYPLEILPMSIQDELELDYKFPIMLDHRIPAADIRKTECNQSTCDIFDLAFRIVAMECLGLKAWPLQLDEFGASFDAKHRNLAFQVVTNLVTTTDIPQIFMISHVEQSYGSLRNVDVTVLDSSNVVLPEGVIPNGNTTIL